MISTDSDHGNQTVLIGGEAVAGVFGLVAVIALAVACIKFRMAKVPSKFWSNKKIYNLVDQTKPLRVDV